MKYIAVIAITLLTFSCRKHEKRLEGSWFVNYFTNDLKTSDFTLKLEEDGTGKIDGATDVLWSTDKKDLKLTIDGYEQLWENNRNKKNTQFYNTIDTLGNYLRMEMERIK